MAIYSPAVHLIHDQSAHEMSSIYATDYPPENHIAQLLLTNRTAPHKPSYGMDSPLGLLASNFLAPLYLYAS